MENDRLYRVAAVACKNCGLLIQLQVIGIADAAQMPMHIYLLTSQCRPFSESCSECNRVHTYGPADVQVVHRWNVSEPIGWMAPSFVKATAPEQSDFETVDLQTMR